MIEKITATNDFVWIIKDEIQSERGGILLPEGRMEKPHTGRIISVGVKVDDPAIVKDKTAIFNKQVGQGLTIFDTEVTVLTQQQVLGVV